MSFTSGQLGVSRARFKSIFHGSKESCSQAESTPAQHDKMVSLVTQMLELHKSKSGAQTQSEGDVREAGRQIRAADESIDGLVYELYELYGLSQDEIKIITS